MKETILAVLLITAVFSPTLVRAHSEGSSYEVSAGAYFIDIGYGEISLGEPLTFNFNLYGADKETKSIFDDVWVRISRNSKTVFAGPIAYGKFGEPVLTTVFDLPGIYQIDANFEVAALSIATSTFSVTVPPLATAADVQSVAQKIGFAILVGVIGFFLGRISKRYV